ncbi:GDSL family lipase [Williamsia sp. Leaf354]|uniref:SGNH/GDSL hydrolase family protein n=1 Tax=Williamsia sp. Leaf354 TaxID=1736349 RepID=UPI000701F159|nr:SGNH/GDSL hydrolase family protein [Williamsia sp. Leaf354]KQR97405.1 GDSL family lipase [Williamsia sp. Leaf354]
MPATRRRVVRDVTATVAATAGSAGAGWAVYSFLTGQARTAREVIPHRTDNAPNGDGLYLPDGSGPERITPRSEFDLHLMVFGDSTAAGLGADVADETPGVALTRMLCRESGLTVRLSTKAIVGATSRGLSGQVDAMLIAGAPPDVAVILVGANDITARNRPGPAARRLGSAVRRLREVDAHVIVGTCPDLGAVTAIPQPLRSVLRQWGFRLAAAQEHEVRAAGGRPVPLADLLAKEFLAAPERMFSADNYHPSAAGYLLAAQTMLPEVLAAIGEWGAGPLPDPPEVSEFAENNRLVVRVRRRLGWPVRLRRRRAEVALAER